MNIFRMHNDYLRTSASLLLEEFRQGDPDAQSRLDAMRLNTKDENGNSAEIDLRDVLDGIADENGYASWAELSTALDHAAESSPLAEIKDQFYPENFNTYWNIWFAQYPQAKKVLNEGGGFLLPFRNQFFIVEEHFVDSLGLHHTLPEWKAIGYDWVRPKHVRSWLKLHTLFEETLARQKRRQA